ncbi:MAG: bifunctional homocysteine S-methyltransferase/methylenetetrahydrofolate reductase [Chthoniobacteraceae bacterium]
MDLLDELQSNILPGDGAMGTQLMEAGISLDRCFEELCVSQPDLVSGIHQAYIAAGARIIETNTFGANAVRLAKHGMEHHVNEINWSAAQLAKDAAKGKGVYVAGSVGPLGITADQAKERGIDRESVFKEQMGALLDGGVNLIFLETFTDLDELLLALYVKQSLHHHPAICSLSCSEEGRLPSGITLIDAFAKLREQDADILGANCLNGPQAMLRLFEKIPAGDLLSAFPNAGYPKYHEGRYLYETTPGYFAKAARGLAEQGARLIGGCCGIGPQHIAAMVEALKNLQPVTSKTVQVTGLREPSPASSPAAQTIEPSILDLAAKGKTVIVTELDPPKTLSFEKYFAGAKALTEAGCDAITLADNSLAILRVSNLALGGMLKERHQITPLLHLSCRDRNLLGLQSDLLGMAALGIRHVLPLTGDPAKVGDHPGAASVYDVNSVELISIIRRLNEGFNHTGASIRTPTQFVIGCTFNPNARNLDAQVSRLERKIAAGAQYVMTQPVFDPALIPVMKDRLKHLDVLILTGVWPLLNGRQAEFLHNEVPGIVIPDAIRARMAGAEGAEGKKRGLEIAKEVSKAILDHFPGIYLITPFLNYETTVELAQFVRNR